MHWLRWSRSGTLGEPASRRSKLPDSCTIGECENRPIGRSMCAKHYWRWSVLGDPNAPVRSYDMEHGESCTVPECDRPYRARGMCATHHERWRAHGDVLSARPIGAPSGEDHPGFLGDEAGYVTAHWRKRKAEGAAKDHPCHHCASPAYDWAYDHRDPNEKVSSGGLIYSTKESHYIPLCRSCHRNFDITWQKSEGAAA